MVLRETKYVITVHIPSLHTDLLFYLLSKSSIFTAESFARLQCILHLLGQQLPPDSTTVIFTDSQSSLKLSVTLLPIVKVTPYISQVLSFSSPLQPSTSTFRFNLRPWSNWTANSDKKLNVNKPYMTSRKTAFAQFLGNFR